MAYVRYQNPKKLDKSEKTALLQEYVTHYTKAFQEHGMEALNAKIPRETFAPILDTIGELLLEHANRLMKDSEVQMFLQSNPLPAPVAELLPNDFRVFSLLLNALKQWVSAESSATDRFLLGGTAKEACRAATEYCIVTGDELCDDAELHHPVRDGRPPILLSKRGHTMVEQVIADSEISEKLTEEQSDLWQKLKLLRAKRSQSWVQLREGCEKLLNPDAPCRSGAKSFANVVIKETGATPQEVILLLDCVEK